MFQLLSGAFLISFSSVFVKLADVGPTAAMFYRFLFGGVVLFAAAAVNREPLWRGWRAMGMAAAGGLIFSLDLFFWHRSIHYVGPGVATILANFQVFSLAAVGAVFMKERLTPRFVISVFVAFVGLFMIVGWDFSSMDRVYRMGIVYGLLTAVVYTALTLTLKQSQRLKRRLSPSANMAWVCILGALAGSFEVLPSGESFAIPDLQSLIVLVAYGAVCSAAGWTLITRGLSRVPVSAAGLALVLQPAAAFVWDVLFFARPTTAVHVAGALITLGAIYAGAVSRSA